MAPANVKIETPDKEDAQFFTGLRLQMKDTDPDYPALILANRMFGGGGLMSRIQDRIRNREGLSYSVGSYFSAPVEGNAAIFASFAIANPANTPKVEASVIDELNKTLKEGFTAGEFLAATKAYMDTRVQGRSSDDDLLSLISAREQYGRTLEWDTQMDAKLQALTVDQVKAAFRRHVTPATIVIVKGGDFKKATVYQ